ncbi:MAG: hypothetical protein ACFFCS_14210 [Candidatus Hodarchaeota archaeon]
MNSSRNSGEISEGMDGMKDVAEEPLESPLNGKLITSFDCTRDYGPNEYFGHQDVRVVENHGLTYRETGDIPSSRFGYRFKIERVGEPHLAVVKYPHDKQRFMCVLDGTCYDLNTGLVTGKVLPLTYKMESLQIIFWPRWNDCSITIMTYSNGEPAAAASIEIHEMPDLPALHQPKGSDRRWLGMQFEDPCGATASVGSGDHFTWSERVIDYARYTGQNLLVYPLAWYHGPLYPSEVEVPDITEIYVAPDRKQYVQWSTQPEDWYMTLLKRFGDEGLSFVGSLTLLRLSTLMKQMNTNIKSIRKGVETINNMVENNRVKESTGDWTKIHNALNYEKIVAEIGPDDIWPGFRMPKNAPYAYGEGGYWANRGGPIFNPIHPVVQEAILAFIKEIGERYKEYPAFKGISINMYASTITWFGSIRLGYDDYTIGLFEKETGIKVPVKPTGKARFHKRYAYLLKHHEDTWISWRCEKIKELNMKIRDLLQHIRDDYKYIITLWDETVFFPKFGTIGKKHQFGTRSSNYDQYREAGIDINLYEDEPGMYLDLDVGCTRDRGGHGPDATAGMNIKPEHSSMYRDFDFLDEKKNAAFASLKLPGTFNFNCWIESWGKYKWFRPPDDDPNVENALLMDGKPVDGMIGCNSFYPEDGFWWNSQLRIVPTFLGGVHFLEPFAHSLAEFDATRITSGGLFLDSAHAAHIKNFARYYTSLPAVKFEQVGGRNDPVVVRTCVSNDERYIYAVNRECFPIGVKIEFKTSYYKKNPDENESKFHLLDLATNEATVLSTKDARITETLGPYGLIAWKCLPAMEPVSFEIEISPDIIQELETRASETLKLLDFHVKGKNKVPGSTKMISIIENCLQEKKHAKLRRALTSYVVRKAEELKKE